MLVYRSWSNVGDSCIANQTSCWNVLDEGATLNDSSDFQIKSESIFCVAVGAYRICRALTASSSGQP